MTLYLPPLSRLPAALDSLDAMTRLLNRALSPAKRFQRRRASEENDLQLAVIVHTLNGLDAARAAHALASLQLVGPLSVEFRVIFEVLVKVKWLRKHPHRATRYLIAEPFERYALANDSVRKSDKWPAIVQECKNSVAQSPWLMSLPGATKRASKRPIFKGIAKALRMPALDVIAKAVGMDDDVYLIDVDFPSLYPHTSVTYTRNFHRANYKDGSVLLSTPSDPLMLLGLVTRTATRIGEIVNELLEIFPDGKLQFDAEKVALQLTQIVASVKGYMPQ